MTERHIDKRIQKGDYIMINVAIMGNDALVTIKGTGADVLTEVSLLSKHLLGNLAKSGASIEDCKDAIATAVAVGMARYQEEKEGAKND